MTAVSCWQFGRFPDHQFKVPDRTRAVRWQGALDGLIPRDHLARFVWEILSSLGFREIEAKYPSTQGGPGRPPYHPRLLAALWIYGLSVGLETAADISDACVMRDDFTWLAGGLHPCDQTLLNFLTRAQRGLASVWTRVLLAMQRAGHVDISVIFEDGTKLRANASPGSFHGLDKIKSTVVMLEQKLAERLQSIGVSEAAKVKLDRQTAAGLAGLRGRLRRAKIAEQELQRRVESRATRGSGHDANGPQSSMAGESPQTAAGTRSMTKRGALFGRDDFRHGPERDALVCPANQVLRLIGEYPNERGDGRYRLFGRSNCSGCALKDRCTTANGRRVKVAVASPGRIEALPPDEVVGGPVAEPPAAVTPPPSTKAASMKKPEDQPDHARDPQGSLTEPEAVFMRATSAKQWEPSYNADLAVTKNGVIISQFLTKDVTDYHHFEPALAFVAATLGRPENWVGDGHYGTTANIVLAAREGVELFAPPAGKKQEDSATTAKTVGGEEPHKTAPARALEKFTRDAFEMQPDRRSLLCPAGQKLGLIGEYPTDNGRGTYCLYGRGDCSGCEMKEKCTNGRGRRVKITESDRPRRTHITNDDSTTSGPVCEGPELEALLRNHESRMKDRGESFVKARSTTVEPTNAHLKQHGLGRFHVHGLQRCGLVLTLGCIAHNLMKWRARLAALRLRLAS